MLVNEIVNRAIEYILEHADNNITIDEIAEYCHISKFHFCRMFKEETGESVHSFIERVRMDMSAYRLKTEQNRNITDIATEFGYSSSNFSSAFQKRHQLSPSDFRKDSYRRSVDNPFFKKAERELGTFEECDSKMSIENCDDFFVIYERRIGNYDNLGKDWCDFLEKYREYVTEETVLLERTFDDPAVTGADKCIYDVCITTDRSCTLENTCLIPGGRFAVYHFKGYSSELYAAYQEISLVWLPKSGVQLDQRYSFEIYRNVASESGYMEIDLCIPIQ